MSALDYAILIVIGLSVVIGLLRGAINEVLSLVGWVAAFWLANKFAEGLGQHMGRIITNPILRTSIAYGVLFLATLIIVWLLRMALSELISAIGLGGFNSILGMGIGFVRGMLIVLIAILVAGATSLPQEPFWREAVSVKWFETIAVAVKPWLPAGLARHINFYRPVKA
ncbi:MAG: CvpA family protein [Pseudomonadota bacterium]